MPNTIVTMLCGPAVAKPAAAGAAAVLYIEVDNGKVGATWLWYGGAWLKVSG